MSSKKKLKLKNISYDDFLKICREDAEVSVTDYTKRGVNRKNVLYTKWTIGGMTGASCWDTGPTRWRSVDAEIEPEFDCIDKILEIFAPQINFIEYKKLIAEVQERFEDGESDFYGNTEKYGVKLIDMRTLFEALVSRGII